MDKQAFIVKRSYLAVMFHFLIFVVLMVVLYKLLTVWLWAICLLIAVVAYVMCMRFPPMLLLQHLHEREWTLKSSKDEKVKQVQISHVIDHRLYIVIYFQHFQEKPLLIWCDQVAWKDWKRLKTLSKLI